MHMSKLSNAANYEILYDLPEGDYGEKQIGVIRTRTIRAGDSLEVESFPLIHIDQGAKREALRRKTTKYQEAVNLRNAKKRLRRLAEKNFHPGDIVLHPTYAYGFVERDFSNLDDIRRGMEESGIPMDEDEARKNLKNYIARIRRLIKRRGGNPRDFKYIYVIESTKEPRDEDFNALPARYHYHMIISSLGILTAEDLQALWSYGYTKAEPLDFRFNGLEGLCNYITKQRKFHRRWAHSKNLDEPDERVSDRKISKRRAAQVAMDVQSNAKEFFETIYKGYRLEGCEVRYSDFVAGAYIYARMRRIHTERRR